MLRQQLKVTSVDGCRIENPSGPPRCPRTSTRTSADAAAISKSEAPPHCPQTTSFIQRIVRVARHQVDVRVVHGLSGRFAVIDVHIETSGRMTLLQAILEGSQEVEATLIPLKRE
jgi:hypothetical protein